VATTTGLTPLVGRESEVALLMERWEQSQAALGQVVLLSGEGALENPAGRNAARACGRRRLAMHRAALLPYHTNSALYPVIEHLQRWLQFQRDDSPEEKLRKLEEALARTGMQVPPLDGGGQGWG
jgi:predicted ATPase